VAFGRVQAVDGLRQHSCVIVEQGFLVPLELPHLLPAAIEGAQLTLGGGSGLFEFGHPCPEFVEADEIYCGHFMIAGPLAVHFGELVELRHCLGFGASVHRCLLLFDHGVKASAKPLRFSERP
jgi:hypothetical protein